FVGGECRGMKQRPERPLCRVESEQKQIAKQRVRVRCGGAICVVHKSEAAFIHSFFKWRGDFAQRERVDLIKSPASGAQFVKRAEKTIGIPSDAFCNEHCFIISVLVREFLGSDGENETKMLAQRHVRGRAATQ